MKPFVRHFFRLDPRSLGLFRILFGLALIGDLSYRWDNVEAFYSNDGVLPNHNHIFNLKQSGELVWSGLHAFSSDGESIFGFCLILLFYAFFTLGYKTRAFQVISAVALLSLAARNTLASGPGDYLAISMLVLTAFLPLGSRFSLDAFFDTVRRVREAKHEKLNQRRDLPDEDTVEALRLPGWSPTSVAAFAVLAQIALVMLVLAMKQTGAWRDGTGLGKALHHVLFASPMGFDLKDSGLVGPLGRVVYYAQWAVPVLLVIPVARGISRGAAAVLLAVHGLTYGLLTNLGLFGWTVAASAAAVISSDTWSAWATRHDPKRVRTVIYDADCGVCYFLCQILKRWDTRRHLVFQPNDQREKLLAWNEEKQKVVKRDMPAGITDELVDATALAVRPDGTYATRGAAAAEVFLALPGMGPLGAVMKFPGISAIADKLYDVVAPRRTAISIELGLAACGLEPPPPPEAEGEAQDAPAKPARWALPPARAARYRTTGVIREVLAAVFLASIFVQTVHQNQLSWPAPKNESLAAISWWSRTLADWSIMTPEPPAEDGYMVVDGFTRSDASIDPLTGKEPKLVPDGPFELGPLWATYLDQIRRPERKPYEQAFRTYLSKKGPRWPAEAQDQKIVGADVYWVTRTGESEPEKTRVFRHGRGGRVFGELGAPERTGPRRQGPPGPQGSDEQKGPDPRVHLPNLKKE